MDIIQKVERKIARGERLSDEDALALFETPDLPALGRLAEEVNRAKNGDAVFYNINRHVNPTNICALSCKFCSFSRKPGEDGAYAYSQEEILERVGKAVAQGATEVHMVGGLHPRWSLKHYADMLSGIKASYPHMHIKAFTAVEIDWLARKARKSVEDVFRELQAAGLDSMPGGGAEIFHPEVRDAICDTKVSAERWIDIHRSAHRLGMRSNCTMLYGHIERYVHRVDHMRRLRELQDETGGFNVFIPLSFQPFDNDMGIDRYTLGTDDLRTIAVARLYLDNFRHIKAYWVMLGQDIAQLALKFGANDLDGTVTEEKISRMAGGRAGMVMNQDQLGGLIREVGKRAVERDTLYRPVAAKTPKNVLEMETVPEPEPILRENIEDTAWEDAAGSKQHFLRLSKLFAHKPWSFALDFAKGQRFFTAPRQVSLGRESVFRQADGENPEQWLASWKKEQTEVPIVRLEPKLEGADGDTLAQIADLALIIRQHASQAQIYIRADTVRLARLLGYQSTADALLKAWKHAGCLQIHDSGPVEGREYSLTETLHAQRFFHRHDFQTLLFLGLSLPTLPEPSAAQEVEPSFDWQAYGRQLEAVMALRAETHGLIGLSLGSQGARALCPYDFLKAVLFARSAVDSDASSEMKVVTELAALPSLGGNQGLKTGSSTLQSAMTAQKYVGVLGFFGVDDFGLYPQDLARELFEELSASGLAASFRDLSFEKDAAHHVPVARARMRRGGGLTIDSRSESETAMSVPAFDYPASAIAAERADLISRA